MIVRWLDSIVNSAAFQNFILLMIGAAAVIVGLETYPHLMERYGRLLITLDWIIIWIFAIEAVMKMAAHGRRFYRYFNDPWNCFDFTIVTLCFIPAVGPYAAVFRLARVLRTLRLISAIPRLQLIVSSLLRGLPSMGYVGLLLLLLFYIYAVMGVFLFRANDPFHFSDLQTSMITLFRVVTLEDWTDVLYTQMYGSDVYPPQGTPPFEPTPYAMPFVAVIYFVSFVLLGTIIMLNLVIGVILSSMQEAQDERDREALAVARATDEGLTTEQEIEMMEYELDSMKRHLHMVRIRVREEMAAGRKMDAVERETRRSEAKS
ncbi:ion transporter [Phycisphaerales bacterium AB-hyl4]|uniref:Ion transporter n=1 Tax=Natronomicrosphaera hydrolytica TaxID=3242702 RepID=A0ABV4U6T0_9BACT